MLGDPGILCFQHCDKVVKIFCFDLPDVCALCNGDLQTSELRIPPFRVPYPFTSAKKSPCSVVIKPTKGDFLNAYQNSTDLHIGITDSKGEVYDFDREGLRFNCSHLWNECLPITIISKLDTTWKEYWDYILNAICHQDQWQKEKYEENSHNCYSFVLSFLRALQLRQMKSSLISKTQFCKDFIVPRTKTAAKYIALYRQLQKENVCIQR
ncbi:MKRN2 opposite strand protein [Centruroides vittatus]|uniref:MKRN2 opposite strand protein n=1 Tax=Centruroides vittatus TaxID=120091 RepID=UPI0035107948